MALFPGRTEFDDLVARAPPAPSAGGLLAGGALGLELLAAGVSLEERLARRTRSEAEEKERHIARLQRRLHRLENPAHVSAKQQIKEIEATVQVEAQRSASSGGGGGGGGADSMSGGSDDGDARRPVEESSSLLSLTQRSDGLAALPTRPRQGSPAWHALFSLLPSCPCLVRDLDSDDER